MPNISEVGAAKVEVENYQCSIKKITVSTKWKAPLQEASETVEAVAYDHVEAKDGKTLYLVTSSEGKKVTVKTERVDGKCPRKSHKNYKMSWDDYKKKESENANQEDNSKTVSYSTRTETKFNAKELALAAGKDALLSFPLSPILLPFNLIKTPITVKKEIKNEDSYEIKCFEVGGAWEALKYWRLPIPLDNKYVTQFSHISCKEGPIHYQIISYPDISFELELSTEANDTDDSHLFCLPTFTATTTYNAKKSKIELEVNFEKDAEEYVKFKYIEQNTVISEFSSEVLQEIPSILKNPLDFFRAVKRILNLDFIHEFLGFDISEYKENTKVVDFKPVPPKGSISVKGQYRTSKDLTKIGKYYEINLSLDPLIGVTCTIDLLYWILTSVSGGAYAGVYVLIKNIKPILEKLLGDDIEKAPVSADIYVKLEITGKINSSLQFFIDTIQEEQRNYSLTPVEGVLDIDLKAGVKASIDILYIFNGEVELSGSASSGISLQFGLEDHFAEGRGLVVPMTILFNGMKFKYCVKACAGFKKVKLMKKYLGIDKEGEIKVWDKKELFSHEFELLKDKASSTEGGKA